MKKSAFLSVITFFCFFALEGRPLKRFTKRRHQTIHRTTKQTISVRRHIIKRHHTVRPRKRRASKVTSPKATLLKQKSVALQPIKNRLQFLTNSINKIVQQTDKKAIAGIKVVSLKNDACLYQKNPDAVFIPASNTKLITGYAAFHVLGPEHTFETKVLSDNQPQNSRINDLYLQGTGDPTLTTKDLENLVHSLKARSIREIKGNIIVDASYFEMPGVGPGWSMGDGPIFDKSPAAGLLIDHSCVAIRVKPARSLRRRPLIFVDPHTEGLRIKNGALTTSHARKHALHVSRTKDDTIVITGTITPSSSQKFYRIALEQPHIFAGHVFHRLLRQHKILCRGRVLLGKTPSIACTLASHQSKPLHKIVKHMMKSSDNLYADALFKKMGAHLYGTPGTWAKGKKAVASFLSKEVKLSTHEVSFNDGSGLSHNNRISPNHLAHFLAWVYKSSAHKDLFIDSLPISGIDGSLRRRMRHKTTLAKVKAKTGSLTGVSSLSGYIANGRNSKEDPLLFVIMVNRKNKSAVEFKRKLEDQLCTLLATHAFSTF